MPKEEKQKTKGSYTADAITVLEGLEAVRRRPGMYIGSTGPTGLHHLIWEVVDNSIDEAMAGHCDEITVRLLPDHYVEVTDNGRGIPVGMHKQYKVSALELVMTKLHAGGKFGGEGYKVSAGLHGVGVSVVNALSKYTKATVYSEGKIWEQEYEIGKPKKNVKAVGNSNKKGTMITFRPDDTIFETLNFEWKTILDHLRQQAYLTKGVKMIIMDERSEQERAADPTADARAYVFYFEGGIASFVRHINHNKEPKHDTIFYIDKSAEDVRVEAAFQYTDDFKETLLAFANNVHNPDGGMHVMGFRTALTRVLNGYARNKEILKEKDQNLTGEDVREGMTIVISVKIREPQFEGQTKAKLGNPEARGAVETVFGDALMVFLEENPREAEAILGKCLLAARARMAAKTARDSVLRKGALEGFTLPGKLSDCSTRDASRSELFIVEGDSAGGSCKMGRDRETQAILPLRGKILNVERSRLDKIISNNELKSLIIAMGTNIGDGFDITKLRYNRVIIATDADVDGAHIRTLLLTLFYRYFQDLITQGHIFIAQPPLYQIKWGKESRFAFNDEEKDKIFKEIEIAGEKNKAKKVVEAKAEAKRVAEESGEEAAGEETKEDDNQESMKVGGVKVNLQRYKGLGEMNPDQLWETTMNPKNRILKRVTLTDAAKADEIFDILMGSEVEPRKKFIQTHAKAVQNLDI